MYTYINSNVSQLSTLSPILIYDKNKKNLNEI